MLRRIVAVTVGEAIEFLRFAEVKRLSKGLSMVGIRRPSERAALNRHRTSHEGCANIGKLLPGAHGFARISGSRTANYSSASGEGDKPGQRALIWNRHHPATRCGDCRAAPDHDSMPGLAGRQGEVCVLRQF